MSYVDDECFYEPPEHWSEGITMKHMGVEYETDKAILFKQSEDVGFWLPKSIILKQTRNTVSFIDCIIVNEVAIRKRDLTDAEWRENELKDLREQMRELTNEYRDFESAHSYADNLLCEALELFGETELVKLWDDVGKWYA